MATTTESPSSNNISPRFGGGGLEDGGKGGNDHRSLLSSGWAEVVRGGGDLSSTISESTANTTAAAISSPSPPASLSPALSAAASSEKSSSSPIGSAVKQSSPPIVPVSAQPHSTSPDNFSEGEGLDKSNSSNVGGNGTKPAWNKLSNGVAQSSGPVMGASSWPALSESTRPLQKSSSLESSNPAPAADVSVSSSQGTKNSNSSLRQGRAIAQRNSNTSHTAPARERYMKRGGNKHEFFPHGPVPTAPPPAPPFPRFTRYPIPYPAPNNFRPRIPIIQSPPQLEMRAPAFQSQISGEHPRPGHLGQRHSVEVSHSNHYGGQYDRNRGRGFVGAPSQGTSSYLPQQPVMPYGNVFYPDGHHGYISSLPMDPFTSMHVGAPPPQPPPGYFAPNTVPDTSSRLRIVKQIDYYFSHDNLVKDEYLKTHMDAEGWVPIELIAGFNKVKSFNKEIPFILDSLKDSNVVQVQGNKIRKRDGWEKWILHHLFACNTGAGSSTQPMYDRLASSFQKASLDEATTDQANAAFDAESCNDSGLNGLRSC